MGLWLIRVFFIASFTAGAFFLQPFGLSASVSLVLGLILSLLILTLELNLRRCSLRAIVGASFGVILGLIGASLGSVVIDRMSLNSPNTENFLQFVILVFMIYVGLAVGLTRGDSWRVGLSFAEPGDRAKGTVKILDTSVIIDGRVGDIVETGFLGGQLIVPEFVLRELQLVADSTDPIKRNRGRRGLDILQKIQKQSEIEVQIVERDFPEIRDVDQKLIELARELKAKIVTNDFNLNKVAQLRGVQVLNINELANAMKAVVLPGESMSVFILKEGKEYNQGVAYLDDGTMVVVDNARRLIGRTIEIQVTSVLQTTAGKMIFGKYQSAEASQKAVAEREKVSRL